MPQINTNNKAANKTPKHKLIAQIHMACKDLKIDNETRVSIQQAITGKSSCKDMYIHEVKKVVDHLKAKGWKGGKPFIPRKGKPKNKQAAKIYVMWNELYKKGIVRNGSEKALNAFVKRNARVEHVNWLDEQQSSNVIEALKKMEERHNKQA